MVYAQPGICLRKWDAQNSLGFWDTNRLSNLGQTTKLRDSQQKKKDNLPNCRLCCSDWLQGKTEGKRKER